MDKINFKDLSVSIDNKVILKNINFEIKKGDVIALLGPNGHGKSTLLKAVTKHYSTKIENGQILVDDHIINDLKTNEIANLGIFLAPQISEEIPGVLMIDFLKAAINSRFKKKTSLVELYNLIQPVLHDLKMNQDFLHRFVNCGFSGGEKKRSEILQMKLLDPEFIFLDEIDSGLDVDSLKIIVKEIKKMISKDKAFLIVSHNEKIFKEIIPNKVIVIMNQEIVKIGNIKLLEKINKDGYDWIVKK